MVEPTQKNISYEININKWIPPPTVDGSEIRLTSWYVVYHFHPLFKLFIYLRWLEMGFLPHISHNQTQNLVQRLVFHFPCNAWQFTASKMLLLVVGTSLVTNRPFQNSTHSRTIKHLISGAGFCPRMEGHLWQHQKEMHRLKHTPEVRTQWYNISLGVRIPRRKHPFPTIDPNWKAGWCAKNPLTLDQRIPPCWGSLGLPKLDGKAFFYSFHPCSYLPHCRKLLTCRVVILSFHDIISYFSVINLIEYTIPCG